METTGHRLDTSEDEGGMGKKRKKNRRISIILNILSTEVQETEELVRRKVGHGVVEGLAPGDGGGVDPDLAHVSVAAVLVVAQHGDLDHEGAQRLVPVVGVLERDPHPPGHTSSTI
jgi:hypothetical protein